jgi:hypothetical protein
MGFDNIPSPIKVGWKRYKVELVDKVMVEDLECYGSCDFNTETILLREANKGKQMDETLLHEVLHAISDMYTLNLEEEVIKPLSSALYTVLEDNNLEITRKHITSVNLKVLEDNPETFKCINGFVRLGDTIQSSTYEVRGRAVELIRSSIGKHLVRLEEEKQYYLLENFYITK